MHQLFNCRIILYRFKLTTNFYPTIIQYIKGTGLKDALIEYKLIGKKTIEQVLNGTQARSLRGIIILSEAIEKLKWDKFSKVYGKEKY